MDKEELFQIVWPGMVVEDNNLTVQISSLRKLLDAGTITTVTGRGYQFTARAQEPLLDLGLAKRVDEVTSDQTTVGRVLGTPLYLAPEQVEAKAVRYDVYL